jgi:hypothetical protein
VQNISNKKKNPIKFIASIMILNIIKENRILFRGESENKKNLYD